MALATKKEWLSVDHAFGNAAFAVAAKPVCAYDHRPREFPVDLITARR